MDQIDISCNDHSNLSPNELVLYFDGTKYYTNTNEKSGISGYGWMITDNHQYIHDQDSQSLGNVKISEAEHHGLYYGLKALKKLLSEQNFPTLEKIFILGDCTRSLNNIRLGRENSKMHKQVLDIYMSLKEKEIPIIVDHTQKNHAHELSRTINADFTEQQNKDITDYNDAKFGNINIPNNQIKTPPIMPSYNTFPAAWIISDIENPDLKYLIQHTITNIVHSMKMLGHNNFPSYIYRDENFTRLFRKLTIATLRLLINQGNFSNIEHHTKVKIGQRFRKCLNILHTDHYHAPDEKNIDEAFHDEQMEIFFVSSLEYWVNSLLDSAFKLTKMAHAYNIHFSHYFVTFVTYKITIMIENIHTMVSDYTLKNISRMIEILINNLER